MIHRFIWESNIIKRRLLNNAKRYKMWSKRSFFLTIDGHPCPLPHTQPFLSYLCILPEISCVHTYICVLLSHVYLFPVYTAWPIFFWLFHVILLYGYTIILFCVLPFPSILLIPNGYLCASFFMPQTLFLAPVKAVAFFSEKFTCKWNITFQGVQLSFLLPLQYPFRVPWAPFRIPAL